MFSKTRNRKQFRRKTLKKGGNKNKKRNLIKPSNIEKFYGFIYSGNFQALKDLIKRDPSVLDYDTPAYDEKKKEGIENFLYTALNQNLSSFDFNENNKYENNALKIFEFLIDKYKNHISHLPEDERNEKLNRFINKKYLYNKTLLHIAVEKNHYKYVELLLKNGADVNAIDIDKKTPLHILVDRSEFYPLKSIYPEEEAKNIANKFELLMEYNADISLKDINGRTPLQYAKMISREPKSDQIIQLLEQREKELEDAKLFKRAVITKDDDIDDDESIVSTSSSKSSKSHKSPISP